jgi:hypothetical protein
MEANDKDQLDKWLDLALKQYGNVEPRAGLERQIIEHLESRNHSVVWRRKVLAFVSVAAACVILIAVWHGETHRGTGTNIAKVSPPSIKSTAARPTTTSLAPRKENAFSAIRRRTRRTGGSSRARAQKFPSPSPLTDRELALAAYAKSFPNEAERIAQDQETFEQEMERAQLELQNTQQLNQEER